MVEGAAIKKAGSGRITHCGDLESLQDFCRFEAIGHYVPSKLLRVQLEPMGKCCTASERGKLGCHGTNSRKEEGGARTAKGWSVQRSIEDTDHPLEVVKESVL
jgi:hypothetical protein